ncbi:hypothetical protein [Natronomonas sp.]|uniref:hypothetical protein n=1 Tax=Natronomonas sp. TaxID=2184060 RepID=UPI002622DADD|nr:hypothetical protein [Natronomonas sp.]
MTEDTDELMAALESIRQEEFPEIPADLVEEIIRIEEETLEEREKTQSRISEVVESQLEDGSDVKNK